MKDVVNGRELEAVVLSEKDVREHGFCPRDEKDQWIRRWNGDDERRLLLSQDLDDDAHSKERREQPERLTDVVSERLTVPG